MTAPRSLSLAIIGILLAVLLTRLVVAMLVPVVQDEAYYLVWSRALDFGYYDHPPLVAWGAVSERLAPGSPFAGRLGTILIAAMSFPFMVGLLRRAGLGERNALLAGLLLANLNPYILAGGLLVLPDAVFITAWCAALHEGAAALGGDRRRWLTAGLATGIGLLGKYIMVLIGPVFLIGIIGADRRALRSPWPWAGALVGLLAFAPHLVWNARNEWVPIRMQLQHGFEGGHDPGFEIPADLPWPEKVAADQPEMQLARPFLDSIDIPPPSPKPAFVLLIRRTAEYLGGLLIVWGAFLPVVVHRFLLARRRRLPPEPPIDPRVRPLLRASVWVPIAFFGFASIFSRVQGNWAAIYVIGGATLLAGFGASRTRPLVIFSSLNAGFLLALAVHARNPVLARGPDRVLEETAGWREMAGTFTGDDPILVAREQTNSMIRFYRPELRVAAWPGITQPSEFVRRPEWQYYTAGDLAAHGSFLLVLDFPAPPRLEGFAPVAMSELRYCLDGRLIVTDAADFDPLAPPCADRTLKQWYVVRYETASPRRP